MKRFVLAASLVAMATVLAGPAVAADLSLKDPTYAPRGVAVNWTGFHLGVQGGYGMNNHDLTAEDQQEGTIPVPEYCTDGGVLQDGGCYDPDGAKRCSTNGNVLANDGQCYDVEDVGTDNVPNQDAEPVEDTVILTDKLDSSSIVNTVNVTETFTSMIDGVGSEGLFGGVSAGADLQRGKFVFGIFGDYNFTGAESKAGVYRDVEESSGDGTKSFSYGETAKIEEGNTWLVGLRAGHLFGANNEALLYGLVGYGQIMDVKYTLGDQSTEKTFNSFVVGAGGEYALSQNLFVGLEGRYWFGEEQTLVDNDNFVLKDDHSKIEVMGRLRFKLGKF
jgi:opacity protein-like surface antigen